MFGSTLFKQLSARVIFIFIAIVCITVLSYAYYAQFKGGVEPCPLCIAQRLIFAATALVALVAAMLSTTKLSRFFALILVLITGFGVKIAYHHVWLQSLPAQDWPASCGMPLEVLYKRIPLRGFIHTILSGSAECAAVTWQIAGISAPQLSLACFIVLMLTASWALIRPR